MPEQRDGLKADPLKISSKLKSRTARLKMTITVESYMGKGVKSRLFPALGMARRCIALSDGKSHLPDLQIDAHLAHAPVFAAPSRRLLRAAIEGIAKVLRAHAASGELLHSCGGAHVLASFAFHCG